MWTSNIIEVFGITCVLVASVSADIATDVQQLLRRVQLVEDKGHQYEETITTMKDQIEQLEEKVVALETSNIEKQTMIDELQDKLNDVLDVTNNPDHIDDNPDDTLEPESEPRDNSTHTDTDNHQTAPQILTQTINNRQDKIKPAASTNSNSKLHSNKTGTIDKQRKVRLTVASENIAFHAAASGSQGNLHDGEHIILDTVLLNVGNGYRNDHGLFIAPVSGIYVFSMTIANDDSHDDRIHVNLLRNGSVLGRLRADGRQGELAQGSITFPVQLQEGDEVWVEIHYPETNVNFYGAYYTSFSGFLLSLS